MIINVHTHVFNFDAVLTRETAMLMKHRLSGRNLPPPLRDAIMEYLKRKLKQDERTISLSDFYQSLSAGSHLKKLVPGGLRELIESRVELPSSQATDRMLLQFIERTIADRFEGSSSSVVNGLEWLRIGLMESIDKVTDDLLTHMDQDDVAVVLPMDIIDKNPSEGERNLFLKQLEDTKRQALRYPGRVLPFAMVNPIRPDAFDLLKRDAESGACVGLKLYPALGYHPYKGVMKEVLRYCNDNNLPVLLHCNDLGFRKSKTAASYGNPGHWRPVFEELPDLKVCFGHFGGETEDDKPVWIAPEFPEDSWAFEIMNLMRKYPGRVFGDLSYHASHLKDDDTTASNYKKNLFKVLDDDELSPHVLWGTDYHLLRMDSDDSGYGESFGKLLGKQRFKKIAAKNPARFLGLPVEGVAESRNITRHVKWLKEHKARAVHGRPSGWLREHPVGKAVEGGTYTSGDESGWDINNRLHTTLFNFVWNTRPPVLSDGQRSFISRNAKSNEAYFEMMGRTKLAELSVHQPGSTSRSQRIRDFANRAWVWFLELPQFENIHDDHAAYYRKMEIVCGDPGHAIPDLAVVISLFFRAKSELKTD
ncbi:MAG: amidohydrolase [Balneolia bacterium]|nr:amidohydrolase [Balneolia bacterium]